ncbi:hypothetical protein [Paractinoplanes abujensis]|uniref:Uncharacterized protein n=1 Tax=Paractinoplanes abujensis TaxID=882441 RepID=A0A7W7CSS3_9ACTN|nr:hypothetical protein [Actinoplanes abujensis]MBB4694007.1 hypothetical protein [Actinoplanes abujensis]
MSIRFLLLFVVFLALDVRLAPVAAFAARNPDHRRALRQPALAFRHPRRPHRRFPAGRRSAHPHRSCPHFPA